jgi:hypothetical protein
MRLVASGIAAFALSITAANAITILSLVSSSCGSWTHERNLNSIKYVQMEGWVTGFISGWAVTWSDAQPKPVDPLEKMDQAALLEWINGYCASHPLDRLSQAASNLILELEARQKSN